MKFHLTKEQEKGLKQQQKIFKNHQSYQCEECGVIIHITEEEENSYCSTCLMKGKVSKLVKVQKKKKRRKSTNMSGEVKVYNLFETKNIESTPTEE